MPDVPQGEASEPRGVGRECGGLQILGDNPDLYETRDNFVRHCVVSTSGCVDLRNSRGATP